MPPDTDQRHDGALDQRAQGGEGRFDVIRKQSGSRCDSGDDDGAQHQNSMAEMPVWRRARLLDLFECITDSPD